MPNYAKLERRKARQAMKAPQSPVLLVAPQSPIMSVPCPEVIVAMNEATIAVTPPAVRVAPKKRKRDRFSEAAADLFRHRNAQLNLVDTSMFTLGEEVRDARPGY
jgi:hypothetical protein